MRHLTYICNLFLREELQTPHHIRTFSRLQDSSYPLQKLTQHNLEFRATHRDLIYRLSRHQMHHLIGGCFNDPGAGAPLS